MDNMTEYNGWRIEEPDEGRYNFSDEKGVWQPKPEDIILIFNKLEQTKGGPLPIKWTCPGRKAPDRQDKHNNGAADETDRDGEESKDAELRAPESSTFDFDEFHSDVSAKLTPRAMPGKHTPRPERKVAKMEDIMNSLRKQQLQRAADREAAKRKSSLGASPARSRLLNFRSADLKSASAKMLSFSPGGKPDTSKAPLDESSSSKPNTSTAIGGEGMCNNSASKSLFTDSTLNSGVSDLSLESRSSKLEPEIEKQFTTDLTDAIPQTSEECLTVSAQPSPPLDTIKPVITNLNDLKDSNSITVIEKSPPQSDFSHPAVPCTVLNLEQISTNNEVSASKDSSSLPDTLQPEFNPPSEEVSLADHVTVIPPEATLPIVSSSTVSFSVSEDTVRPACTTEKERIDTEITNNDETINNPT